MLEQLYHKQLGINNLKKNDLEKLCTAGVIPEMSTKRNQLDVPDFLEESDCDVYYYSNIINI